jgi:adenine-specific DNA-methyltransferase
MLAADRRLRYKKYSGSNEASKKRYRLQGAFRFRRKSNFLNGVGQMEEPRISPSASNTPVSDAKQPVQDHDGVLLHWGGKRTEVDRIVLPFQRIEVVNESRATREAEKGTFFRDPKPDASLDSPDWRNKLIWGDNKYVLGSLLDHYAGRVKLIYIDPPFATAQDFSFKIEVGDEELTKQPSLIEEKAYRDTWGRGIDSYLQMMRDRLVLMREILAADGAIFVHCDWHVGHYLKILMDEVFGAKRFRNEIVWYYYNKMQGNVNYFARNHDVIFYYCKSESFTFYPQHEDRDKPIKQLKRAWDKDKGSIVNVKGKDGKVLYRDSAERRVDDVWRIPMLQPADNTENTGYATQKRRALLDRIVATTTNPNDLVADFFCGSGTTAVAAEVAGRRWLMADLSRWALQMTRKRLLDTVNCRPFEVLDLGKYERQYWQGITFGGGQATTVLHEYVKFVLDLYGAEPTTGLVNLHGQRGGRMIHVGAADAPVTLAEIREAVAECHKIKQGKLDILGWEWEMGLHDVVEAESKRTGTSLHLLQIPREAMDKRAADLGDVHFYELAYLETETDTRGKEVRLKLKNFVIPSPDLIPDEVRKKVKKWSDFIDYWAVDFEFNDHTFHNQWQDYRTRASRDLGLTSDWHEYKKTGRYRVLVKVFDIFGNDTTKLLEVRV